MWWVLDICHSSYLPDSALTLHLGCADYKLWSSLGNLFWFLFKMQLVKRRQKMGSCELEGDVCWGHGWDFRSGACKPEDRLKNKSHDYLVLFSYKNWVQSLRIPRVIVHRANTEIPFSYKMRVHYLPPKTWALGMEVSEKLVNILFILNLNATTEQQLPPPLLTQHSEKNLTWRFSKKILYVCWNFNSIIIYGFKVLKNEMCAGVYVWVVCLLWINAPWAYKGFLSIGN